MHPVFDDPEDGLKAIRSFAQACARDSGSTPAVAAPAAVTFEASMPNGRAVVEELAGAGWVRVGDVEFAVELDTWRDSRQPLAFAMNAALAPFMPYWLSGFANAEEATAADQQRVKKLVTIFDAWAADSHPEWYTQAADPFLQASPSGSNPRRASPMSGKVRKTRLLPFPDGTSGCTSSYVHAILRSSIKQGGNSRIAWA
jgi:hypothetical protein